MTKNSLIVTLDGLGIDETGVPAEEFLCALEGVRTAMRLMVMHLGDRKPGPGQPPAWVRDQSRLRLAPTRPGSFVAELTVEPPSDAHPPSDAQLPLENFGQQAIVALRDWDGAEDSTLPHTVTDHLYETASDLLSSTQLFLGNIVEPRRIQIRRPRRHELAPAEAEEALLQGWLREVNWDKHTAQLYDYAGEHVRLRFDPSLGDEMIRLATQYVEVRGRGYFSQQGEWKTVDVQQLSETRSSSEPFDLDAFLNDPDAKVFDPSATVTVDLTEDEWESFNRAIRGGREV